MKDFLNTPKPGMGDKYGASFAEEGLETEADLERLGTPAFHAILVALFANLSGNGAKAMDLRIISNHFSPCASAAPRGERDGGGTGSVAVHNAGDAGVAARAAAPNDDAAAGVDNGAGAADAAAPSAPDASNGGGGEDIPQRGEDDVYTFLEEVSPGFSELFQLALKGVGVSCATTLDQFVGVEDKVIGLQVEEFESPTWKKLLLVQALQAHGGKKRQRAPRTTTNEPEPDAGLDEAGRQGDRKDETIKRTGRRCERRRSRSSDSSDSDKSIRASGRRRRNDRRSRDSSDSDKSHVPYVSSVASSRRGHERDRVKKRDKKTRQRTQNSWSAGRSGRRRRREPWRTKVRIALHRTTHVVSLHLLTNTVMTRTTRSIARAILIRTRLSGLLTGTGSTTSSKRTSGIIRVTCVVLLLLCAIQHYHNRTSTRRRGQMLLPLCRRRRRPHQPMGQYRCR